MSEWWTYSLSDFLLFSRRTYYRLFELYNVDIWPAQSVALALGCVLLALLWRPRAGQGRFIAAILALCWVWVAWAFHWRHFTTINWAATYFAYAFVLEAVLLIVFGVLNDDLAFEPGSPAHRVGFALVLFAVFGEPLIAPLVGRGWLQAEVFGVAPDPTAVGTLGALLAGGRRALARMGIIPLISCALSGAVTWTLGSPDAPVMLVVALVVLAAAATKTARKA
jgi:hypothetical protein